MNSNRKGMVSVESILAIATGALVLVGLIQFSQSSLLPDTNATITKLLNWDVASNEGSGSDLGSNSSDNDFAVGSGSGSDNSVGQPVSSSDQNRNDGNIDPVGDGLVKDLVVEYAKAKASELVEVAKEKVAEEIKNNLPSDLPMGLELDLEELDSIDADLRGGLTEGISTVFDAIGAVDGLTQADREVKELAEQGKYEEAFGKIFSGSSRFVVDAIMSAPGVDKALDKLPLEAQAAVKAAIPNAIESAAQSLGEQTFGAVGKEINDKLWNWYDQGYLPRKPRIPRDHQF